MSKWELNNTFCLISWERNKVWHWNFVHWCSVTFGKFLWKNHAENVHQKLARDPFLILVSKPKQLLHAINSFLNKIFWKRIIRKPLKNNFTFFQTQSLLIDKVIKSKSGLEQVSSCSSGYKTSSNIFLYSIHIIWPSLMM